MTKICVISDSHGHKSKVEDLLLNNNFDYVFFLGDGLRDLEDFDNVNIKKVSGNCDFFSFEPLSIFANVGSKKVFLTHGHSYKVKLGLGSLTKFALENNCDIVCYGHTHNQKVDNINGTLFVCPGALKNGNYAVINIDGTNITVDLI